MRSAAIGKGVSAHCPVTLQSGLNPWLQIHPTSARTIQGRNVEEWLTPDATSSLSDNRTVGSVLSVLRNSLAHGNLYSRAGNGNVIQQLVFLSKRRDDRPVEPCPS